MDNRSSVLRRTSINVSEINIPFNLTPRNSIRRSFRASETNDVVPKLKGLITNDDKLKNFQTSSINRVSTKSTSSSSSSSSSSVISTDSKTPSLFSVILVFESENDSEINEKENKPKSVTRMSKMLYPKSSMKLLVINSSSTESIVLKSDDSTVTVREDKEVLENALSVLKKFNCNSLQYNENEQKNKMCFSFTSFDTSTSLLKSEDEKLALNQSTKDFAIPENFWKDKFPSAETSKMLQVISFKSRKSSTLKTNNSDKFDVNIDFKNSDEFLKIQQSDEKQMDLLNSKQTDDDVFNIDNDMKSISILSEINIPLKKSNESEVLKNENKSLQNRKIKDGKNRKIKTRKKYLTDCEIFSRSGRKFENLLIKEVDNFKTKQMQMIAVNQTFFYPAKTSVYCQQISQETISLKNLLINDDILVINKCLIINLNDISDAIAKTIIYREFGLSMMSEALLIKEAINMVKLKSKTLQLNFVKKFPILQTSICNMINHKNNCYKFSTNKYHLKSSDTRLFNLKTSGISYILNMNSLRNNLKVSCLNKKQNETFNSNKSHKLLHLAQKTYKFQNDNPYKSLIEKNLRSLKKRFKSSENKENDE